MTSKLALDAANGEGTFPASLRIYTQRNSMKSYFANLPQSAWFLLALPALAAAYSLARAIGPAVIHAVLPESVRAFLSLM